MNNHTVIGVDLAKTVFQVAVQHGQQITSNKKLTRSKLVEFMTQQPPSVVVMEACYTAHYWARGVRSTWAYGSAHPSTTRKAVYARQ